MHLKEVLMAACFGLVVYAYVIYPCVLMVLSAIVQVYRDGKFVFKGGDRRMRPIAEQALPNLAVIISAFNEADCIAERVRNLQQLDYPKNRIKYYIGSDGSSDNTVAILNEIGDDNLIVVDFAQNRGKASVLNDLVVMADAEYLVFSDANTCFQPDALQKLLRHFSADARIDAVCGELQLVDEATGKNQDGIYWKYERLLKFHESRLSGLLGANGAIYAIRKQAYVEIPASTIVDDFTIVLQIAVNGGAVVYDPEAVALEEVAPSTNDEYRRRVRIGAGNYQACWQFRQLLSPRYGMLWFTYFSHKVLRWHTPHALALALLLSLLLSAHSLFYATIFVLQCAAYIYSYKAQGNARSKLLNLIVFWIQMNMALGHGAWRYYRGKASGQWHSTAR